MSTQKEGLFIFVITACDGRHAGEPKSWEDAHKEAAEWLGRPVERLLNSYGQQYGRENWEAMDGQEVRVEPDGQYEEFMRNEFGDDWAEGGTR